MLILNSELPQLMNNLETVGERLNLFRGTVVLQDSVCDHRDVSVRSQKLHDFGALAGHFCPAGFGLRVLFQAAKFDAFHLKIKLCQMMFGGSAHGEGRAAHSYGFLLFHECLAPHRDECIVDGACGLGSSHEHSLGCPRGILIWEMMPGQRRVCKNFGSGAWTRTTIARFKVWSPTN